VNIVGKQASAVRVGLSGRRVRVHDINLFQGQSFGLRKEMSTHVAASQVEASTHLRDTEVCEKDTAEAGGTPDEEHLGLETC
jgi:hypothetical protein